MNARRIKLRGFTLIELMVALTAGTFAVAGVYYLGNISARAYTEQMRMGDAQMSLRSAMDQIRRDFARAGYLGARNVNTEHLACAGDPDGTVANGATIQAVEVRPDLSMTAPVRTLLNEPENRTRADVVRLWGNYTTSDAYLVAANSDPARQVLTFQTTRESFRRSFFDPAVGGAPAPSYNADRFTAAFEDQWVRVEYQGRFWFRQVQAVNPTEGAQSITVTPPLPDACFRYSSSPPAIVSPLSRITYMMDEVAVGGELARLRSGTVAGADRAVLLRREEDLLTGDPIPGTTRLVLDYAVEFAVDGVINTSGPGVAPVFAYATPPSGTGTVDLDTVSSNTPEQFRALRVTLSSRTTEANPRLPRMPRTNLNAPFLAFRIAVPAAPTAQLWAPVRSLRSEIFLPNLVAAPQ
jgi:prepilin-type N-terminal cleavage/methylation domain-containing protein